MNEGDGIFVNTGSTVTDNGVTGNGGDAIQALDNSLFHRNTSSSNTGWGLQPSSETGYRENVVNGNIVRTVLGGLNPEQSLCDGGTTCP